MKRVPSGRTGVNARRQSVTETWSLCGTAFQQRQPEPPDTLGSTTAGCCAKSSHEQSVRCLIHDDDNPSCSVNLEKGTWFCHACGQGGDGYTRETEGGP